METFHNSLICFAKICTPSFKNFPDIWSIPAASITSTKTKSLEHQFGGFGKFGNKFLARFG